MIRKVYSDFLRDKLAEKEFRWLLSRFAQYLLVPASSLIRRPLCGPVLGTLVTNYRCNYRCVMCDLPDRNIEFRDRGMREFDTARMKALIGGFARLGAPGVGFTGGEPLLRTDIFELLSYTKKRGMITHLNTNGSLVDDGTGRGIIASGVDSINISLDGARAEAHDAIRGVIGAFDRAVRAIELIAAERKRSASALRIKTVAVIGEQNIDEVPDLVRLAADLKVDCVEFIPRQPFTTGAGVAADEAFLQKVDNLVKYLSGPGADIIRIENSPRHLKLFRRSFSNEPSPLKCFAGYNSLAVDCFGEVYPCVPWYNWRRSAGNVGTSDLVSFWRSPECGRMRKEASVCRKCYLNCQAELNILFNPFAIG